MDELLKQGISQVPGLAVLAWVVWRFLESQKIAENQRRVFENNRLEVIKQMELSRERHETERMAEIQRMANACHEVQRDAIESINKNSEALGGIKACLEGFK